MPEDKTPDPKAIEETVGKLEKFVQYVIGVLTGKNWTTKLLLLDVLLFAVFNPVFLPRILEMFGISKLPEHYARYFWLVIGAVFVAAVIAAWRARPKGKPFRDPGERSTIKGLLPFGYADREIFKQLQRETDLTECCQAVNDRNFRFGVLSGESGAGKTSFLQAGLWPALLEQHRCVYVKFTDLDPVAAIKQAFIEQQISIPETTPADAPLSTLLVGVAQSDTKPLVLLLDQFEQFFVHFKRESRRRPFIRELNEWYRNGRGLPVKILICIRGDFLDHLSELQEAMAYSLGPQQKFRLKKFRPEQAAAVFRVIAETEKLDCDESFIKELTERELAGADDGLISPVDIQILAWMIAGQAGHEERAFNRTTFQKLGGVEGLLERFLTRALEARETTARRQAATKVLLALTDLDRNARAGALTLDELRQKLGDAVADAELKEAVEWLSRGDVRLIASVKLEEVDSYELAHERLIPALRRIAGKELSEADRASLLLDRRFNEWTGNDRDRRYRLIWRELRSIKKQTPFMQWEPNRKGKESLIAASWRQIQLRLVLVALPVLLAIAFASVWYSQWGQLQHIKWTVAGYSNEISEPKAIAKIASYFATAGNFPQALQAIDMIGNESDKASALQAVAEVYAKFGEGKKAAQLLNQALLFAEKIEHERDKATILQAIVGTCAKLEEKEIATQLLSQAIMFAEKIGDEFYTAFALQVIAEAYAKYGEKEKSLQLLSQASFLVEKIDSVDIDTALKVITATYTRIGEKQRENQLLSQALLFTEKIDDEYSKVVSLQTLAVANAKLGEKEKAGQLLGQAFSLVEKIGDESDRAKALHSIAEANVKIGENKKAIQLFAQSLFIADKIVYEYAKADALKTIVEASAGLGKNEGAAQLLGQALSLSEKIGDVHSKTLALKAIAESYAKLGEKEKAVELLSQALSGAEKIGHEGFKAMALQTIAEAYAKLEDFRMARASALKIPSEAGKATTMAAILEIWAKSKNPLLADEVSKDEE